MWVAKDEGEIQKQNHMMARGPSLSGMEERWAFVCTGGSGVGTSGADVGQALGWGVSCAY